MRAVLRPLTLTLLTALVPLAAAEVGAGGPALLGIPVEFVFFGATLLGVALFHHRTLQVALCGLVVIAGWKLGVSGFLVEHHGAGKAVVHGLPGFVAHLGHEWVTLANLLGLLLGFDILSHHFSASKVPALLPRVLPDDWKGGFVLLVLVFVLSSFLDNIAAAMIGGTVAASVFKGRVHVGYLAAIVAAANAGGAGSVVGDTTTTMMWIDGISPLDVVHAYVAAVPALLVFGVIAARQQHRHQPIAADPAPDTRLDGVRVLIVAVILAFAIGANVVINVAFNAWADAFPWIGAAVWAAILLTAPLRRPHWHGLLPALRGACFLLALVLCASMMPVESLPAASWMTAVGLGFVSAVFDNIPLTKLALTQGGYDWGVLAYAVGFGGSMIWFGSSAGVAISNSFAQAKSVGSWLRHGWHVALGYVVGAAVLLLALGWHPHAQHRGGGAAHGDEAGAPAPAIVPSPASATGAAAP